MRRYSFIFHIILCSSFFFSSLLPHGFSADTWIQNCNGTWRASIKSLCLEVNHNKKRYVASYDTCTDAYCPHAKIIRVGKSTVNSYVILSCASEYTSTSQPDIVCSPVQLFYCTDTESWKAACTFYVGDYVLSKIGPKEITCIKLVNKSLDVYTLEVEETHTFYVGRDALLVHNMFLPGTIPIIFPVVGTGAAVTGLASFLGPVAAGIGLAATALVGCIASQLFSDSLPTYQSEFAYDQEQSQKQDNDANYPSTTNFPNPTGPKKDDDKDKKTAKMPRNEDRLGHIFRNDRGHLPKTPDNYRLIEELVQNVENYLGPDGRGNHWWAKILDNGEQIWAQAYNGIVRNAGLNKIPRPYNPQTGLSTLI